MLAAVKPCSKGERELANEDDGTVAAFKICDARMLSSSRQQNRRLVGASRQRLNLRVQAAGGTICAAKSAGARPEIGNH